MEEQPPPSVEFLDDLLARHGDLGPKPERVTEQYADERIREKIARYDDERQQAGLWSINRTLQRHGVPPEVRLHLVQAVSQLHRVAEESLPQRVERANEKGAGPGR